MKKKNEVKMKQPPPTQQLIDKMRKSDNKVPLGTKVVSEEEFKRLAQENMAKDGKPMVEKTIFIVKPIYINADDLKAPKKISKHKARK